MTHSLSRRSRSRRRLIIRQLASQKAARPRVRIAETDDTAVEALARTLVAEGAAKPNPVRRDAAAVNEAPTAGDSLAYLRELLTGDRPVTWVIAGEDFCDHAGDRPSVGSLIEKRIRRQWHRPDDHVVDSTFRGDRLLALDQNLDRRVLRFDPAAAFLIVGGCDPRPEQAKYELKSLDRTLARLQKAGVVPVVLPPVPELCADELTLHGPTEKLREAVEEVARRRRAVLVPTAECRRPELLAMALFRTLGLNKRRPGKTSPTVPLSTAK